MNEQIHNQKPVNLPDDENTPQEWHLHLRRGAVGCGIVGVVFVIGESLGEKTDGNPKDSSITGWCS